MELKKKVKKEAAEIEVKVARVGGKVEIFSLEEGSTVEDALDTAGIDHKTGKTKIRVNGAEADLDDELEDGDRVTVTGKITGGTCSICEEA